jgi:hypothetical protein
MWGFVGANNRGWYGSGLRAPYYRNILDPAPEPIVFNPARDLSDCELWLDANDPSTITTREDNHVLKWFDKAKPDNQNYYRHSGSPNGSGLYNTHYMNQLPTVYFPPNAFMEHQGGGVVYRFQARTFFAVIKPLTDLTTALNPFISIYNGYSSGAMNTGFSYNSMSGNHSYTLCENGITCGIVWDLSNNPVNQRMILMFAQTDSFDLSGNVGSFDTISQPLTVSDPADSYDTSSTIQYYLNDSVKGTAQDIAEIIMYGRLLTTTEQTRVLEYLADKWNLSGAGTDTFGAKPTEPAPLPGTPPPFAYTYIIYGVFDGGFPNWFWCDENQQVESPAVLADGYDGTTALRDGLAVVVSGVFYA